VAKFEDEVGGERHAVEAGFGFRGSAGNTWQDYCRGVITTIQEQPAKFIATNTSSQEQARSD